MKDFSIHRSGISILLLILIVTCFASGFEVGSASLNLNLSQLFTMVVGLILIAAAIQGQAKVPILFTDPVSVSIYLYFLTNLYSSILMAGDPWPSLKNCMVILLYVCTYSVTRACMELVASRQFIVNATTHMNLIIAGFGLACMVLAMATGSENVGVSYGHLYYAGMNSLKNPPPSIRALSLEPNMFAIITATIFSMNLSRLMTWKFTSGQVAAVGLLSVAILFAYTRSVYVAMIFSVAVLTIFSNQKRIFLLTAKYAMIMGLVISVLIFSLPETNSVRMGLISRAKTLVDFKSGSGLGRMTVNRIGLQGLDDSLLIGQGTLTAHTEYRRLEEDSIMHLGGAPGWLMGLWVQALHDTGIIGFAVVLGLFASLLYTNFTVFKRLPPGSLEKSMVLGFIGGNVVILITAQLSSPMWIAFPWIYWGLNMSYLAWCRKLVVAK